MKYIKKYKIFESELLNDLKLRKSITRTKSLSDEEFLKILKDYCKNFTFQNDILWRKSNVGFGSFGLFFEKERQRTIGEFNYKNFFDLRKDYPVSRHISLIGSTSKHGANYFGNDSDLYMVIPFDNSQIVFAGSPDIAIWAKLNQEFTDDLFVKRKYCKNFRVPVEELTKILSASKLSGLEPNKLSLILKLGFEFFTSSPCLLIHESKIDWLKENMQLVSK